MQLRLCHGAALQGTVVNATIPAFRATDERLEFIGFPKSHQRFHYIHHPERSILGGALSFRGSPGTYVVTFLFCRPGYKRIPEKNLTSIGELQGTSHLAITKPAFTPPWDPGATDIRVGVKSKEGDLRFIGHANEEGFLSKLVSIPFQANSKGDAEEIAYRAVSSLLSNISLHLDIPLEIERREVKELATESIQISFLVPHIEAPLRMEHTGELIPELKSYAALYRESLNTNSPAYEFLCLFKIIESLRGRRKRLSKAARQSGAIYSQPQEMMPSTDNDVKDWLDSIFYVHRVFDLPTLRHAVPSEMRGRTADDVFENILNPLRVHVAHALFGTDSEVPLSPDDLLHIQQVTHCLHVTKCLARRMLKNDFPAHFLAHVPG